MARLVTLRSEKCTGVVILFSSTIYLYIRRAVVLPPASLSLNLLGRVTKVTLNLFMGE